MAQSKVCRTVTASDIWAVLIVSLVVLVTLLYFDVEATIRYLRRDASHQLWLGIMAILFLLASQVACIFWIHIRNNVPRELDFLERYLNRGKIVVGDVHFPSIEGREYCQNQPCCNSNIGSIVYRHPMAQYKGCFVRKEVKLLDTYSRELETMLILPGEPYSAQPKSDIQGLLAVRKARYEVLSILGIYSLCYYIFTLLSAAYVLYVRTYLDTNQDQSVWMRYGGWAVLGTAAILIPVIALLLSIFRWNKFFDWFKRGNARFVQDDDDEYSHLTHLPAGMKDNPYRGEV